MGTGKCARSEICDDGAAGQYASQRPLSAKIGVCGLARGGVAEGCILLLSSVTSPRWLCWRVVHTFPEQAKRCVSCASRSCRYTQHSPVTPEQMAMVPASALMVSAPLGGGGRKSGLDRETSVVMGTFCVWRRTSTNLFVLSEYTSTAVW
ncbi:hypothetical protein TCAP_01394 [Tolypocladium capitatum]|uniref:Uncharacterized protein n=1 Tax=Tolypocladium capitatum TaxID=45235 RepID=A0A2K3QMC5_9HYPO|nr:hypothetical protein TCAP_01394 [Tolypocladium capitatum]